MYVTCSDDPINSNDYIKIVNENKPLNYIFNENELNIYNLVFSAYSLPTNKELFDGEKIIESKRSKLKVYLSGSAFGNSDRYCSGKCVWESSDISFGSENYSDLVIPFEADNDGTGKVVFIIESGE